MRTDSKLSGILHVLLHLADHTQPMTSDELATCLATNPVVVRRTLAGLRQAGLVRSEKGHGGGWTLARDPQSLTLRDVYGALGEPTLFAIGNRTESPVCLAEQAANAVLRDAIRDAEAVFIDRLSSVSLADLAADVHHRLSTCQHSQEVRAHAV
jgi:Rrf2 family protein